MSSPVEPMMALERLGEYVERLEDPKLSDLFREFVKAHVACGEWIDQQLTQHIDSLAEMNREMEQALE